MKASEAKQISQGKTVKLTVAYSTIMGTIKSAAKDGDRECWYYDSMTPELKKKLRKDGYKVGETMFDRNDTLTKISW